MDRKLNTSAVLDFIEFGMVRPGDHFFHNGGLQLDRKILQFIASDEVNAPISEEKLASAAFSKLEEAIDAIIAEKKVDAFALSGSISSRIILAILNKNHQQFVKSTYVYSRAHPLLGPEKDRDCLIACDLAKLVGIELNIEVVDPTLHDPLLPIDDCFSMSLSGLWGSDVLCGDLLAEKTFSKFDLFTASKRQKSDLCDYVKKSIGDNIDNYLRSEYFLQWQLMRTSLCTARRRLARWLNPGRRVAQSRTPFVSEQLIILLRNQMANVTANYNLCREIFKLCSTDLQSVPVRNLKLDASAINGLENYGIDSFGIEGARSKDIHLNRWQVELKEIAEQHPTARYASYLIQVLPDLPEYFEGLQE